ncbi:MAG: hybrid sensor histidine kinase/response regulator [Bdellovibrionota bacterium]
MPSNSDIALGEFFSECEEILQRVSSALQSMEAGPQSAELVGSIYRDMHTMKGSAQLFGFKRIAQIAHALEASLDPVRKFGMAAPPALIDASLAALDLEDRIVKHARAHQTDEILEKEMQAVLPGLVEAASALFHGNAEISKDSLSPMEEGGDAASLRASAPPSPKAAPPEAPAAPAALAEKKQERQTMNIPPLEAPAADVKAAEALKAEAPPATAADSSIRVQVSLLDRLMNLVGELVLVRNQVLQFKAKNESLEFLNLSQGLDAVATELQCEVMKTRMQPINSVVGKFQRVVRDLAKDLGKKIDLTLEGADTEVDKTLLEAIRDPLTHLIRNSCDHGIEGPEERKAANKPENGHVLLRSYHEGGQVIVEISDDGKGLHKKVLLKKALEKGLITEERAERMTEREIFQIIFMPGFSTASQVTAVSGRGVGMDVVKTNIEKIGGTVEISSSEGKGTSLRLKIPLTLAIVPALIVRQEAFRYAISLLAVVELVRVDADSAEKVEQLQGYPIFRLRGELLPLVALQEVLGQGKKTSYANVNIVVVAAEGERFGLVVDEILDTADIVVKPLGTFLKSVSAFSGATIMGDGSVALILDVMGIADLASINTKSQRRAEGFLDTAAAGKNKNSDVQEFLIVRSATESAHAIPLCLVHRLEEFPASLLEVSGNQAVIRYRDSILPLVNLGAALGYGERARDERPLKTVVVSRSGRLMGIVVEDILDVVSSDAAVDDSVRDRFGILGNIIDRDRVIVIVDALSIVEREFARMANVPHTGGSSSIEEIKLIQKAQKNKKVRVLFAEDVAFFRKQVSKVLASAGHEVMVAEDGAQALKILEESEPGRFNLILSDIEMPKLTGLEFARKIRQQERFAKLPLIALTTRFRQRDIDEGKKAGFDRYMEKLNSEALLRSIDELIGEE